MVRSALPISGHSGYFSFVAPLFSFESLALDPYPELYELVCLDHSDLPPHPLQWTPLSAALRPSPRLLSPSLDAQERLHNMARARRRCLILRLRTPEIARDIAWNKSEINRLLATERIDPDSALMMLWAMDLATAALRAESACRPRRAQNRASNHNGIYDVPLNPLFSRSLSKNLSQVIENTMRQGGGGTTIRRTREKRKANA